MAEAFPGTKPSVNSPEDRLDSWKEIAAYLHRDVTTVQRWEKREGMPVHRHLHERIGSVSASRAELDAWALGRNLQAGDANGNHAVAPDSSTPTPVSAVTISRVRWRFLLLPAIVVAALAIGAIVWVQKTEYFWRSPIADARFETITDFDGLEQAAAISRDGQFVAFLSDRDGQMDVWVTQVGSGQFHNLTRGAATNLVDPLLRTVGFSPDGSLVTYWTRRQGDPDGEQISIWAVPTLGGEPKPYLEGVAEYDWTRDGTRLAYHTPGPGDPLFVVNGNRQPGDRPIFTAQAGLHSHFPLWSKDSKFIYLVKGTPPDKLDIWRIRSSGGTPERITSHNARVTYPVFLNSRTLMYLASDPDGAGPWLYSIDVERRIPHRLSSGVDRYTSLASSADGGRLVVTRASPKRALWRLQIDESGNAPTAAIEIPLTTGTGFWPRLGPNYLLYVSANATSQSIWKVTNGTAAELWSGEGARILGGPAISPDGKRIGFSVAQADGRTALYVMAVDGTNARVLTDSLHLEGTPTWSPDGESITSAAEDHGVTHLFRVPLDGKAATGLVSEYSLDPTWAPNGGFVVYSGPDVGTTFPVKAVTAGGAPHPLPALQLTRGGRRMAFLAGGRELVVLRGEMQHMNLWAINLETGAERQLTNFTPEFDIRDFDVSADGREIVLERIQERSDVVLMDIPRR
jgi:Tol biopolymer transport system component